MAETEQDRSLASDPYAAPGVAEPAGDGTPARRHLRVLVLLAHPRGADSFCGALAAAYARGAAAAGAEVASRSLAEGVFERDVLLASPAAQPLEPALADLRGAIDWADHLVLVYPTWWGTYPALLKAALDRVLIPGWAFRETTGGTGFEGLLKGRTAECLTTMDTPVAVYRFLYRAPGDNALKRATLDFCGLETLRFTRFAPVKEATPTQRQAWLARAEALGRRLRRGARQPADRLRRTLKSWLLAVRPQFYLMTFLAYLLGSLGGALRAGVPFEHLLFWLGYLALFLTEAASVFVNEVFDFESDRRNRFFGPFTGGSRVLTDGRLTRRGLLWGAALCAGTAVALTVALAVAAPANGWLVGLALAVTLALGLGYSLPPAKLCHRTLGEPTVAFTHSASVVLAGFLLQQGSPGDGWPWLVSLPLFLAILPAIALSGVPDAEADAAAGKRSFAVRFGIDATFGLALTCTLGALVAAVAVALLLPSMRAAFLVLAALAALHAAWLLAALLREGRRSAGARRIDGLMVRALSFILWFALAPLLALTFGLEQ